jgi:drug/metabolite transporter (DMT)-like permease
VNPTRRGIAAASVAAVLWGCGTVATAAVLRRGVPPGPFTVVELASSVAFLGVLAVATRTPVPDVRRAWRAGALGLLEPGATYLLMNAGLARTAATHAALIGALEPVLIVLLGWVLLRLPLPRRLLLPMGAVVVGSAAVVLAQAAGGRASVTGDLLVAAGVLCASVYVLGSSRIDPGLPAIGVVLLQQLFALVLVIGVVAITSRADVAGDASAAAWLAVAAIGVTSSALTFWLYLVALRHLPAGTAGQFLAAIPVVGFLGAVVVLGEEATVPAALGAALVVLGLVLVARGEQRAADQAGPADG